MAKGKPGPALTIGVPLVILLAGGYFGYTKLIAPALEEKAEQAKNEKLGKSTSMKKRGTMVRVAGDPWSGYSTFRNEPRFAEELGKHDIGINYIDKEKYYDQGERMKALKEGKIDLALTTLDAFLQHGAKHKKDGLYPGVILWNVDESNGGDAVFLGKGKKSFDDVKPSDKVCYAAGTPSEHLWDFASLSFESLESVKADTGVVAADCWKKLKEGKVQIAVLWQPFTAIAEKEGYSKVFATGGQADDVIVDIVVGSRDYVIKNGGTIEKVAAAYFKTIGGLVLEPSEHAKFITADCGPDCKSDEELGEAVLRGIDFLTYEENACLWWGQCGQANKMEARIGKTGRLLRAKGKVSQADLPKPAAILNDSFIVALKKTMEEKAKLAAEVSGDKTKAAGAKLTAKEATYKYDAAATKHDEAADVGTLKLPSLYFQEGKSALDQNGKSIVDNIGEKLKSFPALCVRVYGHTNSTGSKAANKSLSERRAQSIVAHLKQSDQSAFPDSRFDARGFGSERPIMSGGAEDKEASRRTEFRLFNCKAATQ